jgi:hypothetical protein
MIRRCIPAFDTQIPEFLFGFYADALNMDESVGKHD